jgi:hypothetical protein
MERMVEAPGARFRIRSAVRLAHQYVDRYGCPDLIHTQSTLGAANRCAKPYGTPTLLCFPVVVKRLASS